MTTTPPSTVQAQETEDGLLLTVQHHQGEDETTRVMDDLIKLLQQIDGKEGNINVPSQEFDNEFAQLFDEANLQARVVRPVLSLLLSQSHEDPKEWATVSFDEYKQQWLEFQERGYNLEVIDTQRYVTGAFDFTIQLTNRCNDQEIHLPTTRFRTAAMMQGSKICYCEQKMDHYVKVPPAPAKPAANTTGMKNPKRFPGKSSSWAFASISDLEADDVHGYSQDETIKAAIHNFTILIGFLDGTKANLNDTSGLHSQDFAKQFAATYDPKVKAKMKPLQDLTSQSTLQEMDYDTLYQQHYGQAFWLGFKAEVVRIKPHIKGVVAFTVHMVNETTEMTIRTVVFIADGKIVTAETTDTTLRQVPKQAVVVSGQVSVEEDEEGRHPIAGYGLSEAEFAGSLLPVSGKILAGQRSGMVPCLEAGSLLKLYVERGKVEERQSLLPIYDSRGQPYADGAHFEEYQRRVIAGKALVLKDGKGQPRALCFQDLWKVTRKGFDIYSIRPLWHGDSPFELERDVKCYPWFRMEATPGARYQRIINVWNGHGYQRMWRAFLGKPSTGDQERYPPNKGDLVVRTESLDVDLAYVTSCDTNGKVRYDITIAPGVDPALILCLAAVSEMLVGLFG
mmetsp:Transcript_3083/g.8709  ORF Transcript_3083/g.8709 Transcript_3083/m.8709 type:complete len:621 (-) Transcript_3083:207-2069(-)